jgi:glycosyltransferase involved in cell wall biosynthesis
MIGRHVFRWTGPGEIRRSRRSVTWRRHCSCYGWYFHSGEPMTSAPLVSVIIPAYNAEAFIGDTLDSVLAQTYPNIEVIVSDDGSVDGTRRRVAPYRARVRYVYGANSGAPARPRNLGTHVASGALLAFIDADDLMAPGRIAAEVDFLERHPEAGLVFSDYEEFGDDRTQEKGHFQTCPLLRTLLSATPDASGGLVMDPATATELLLTENFGSSSPTVRRRVFEAVGGYDEELTSSEDFEFQFRVASSCSIGVIPQIHWFKRQHPSNMSAHAERTLSRKIEVRRRILATETIARRRRKLRRRIAAWHADLAYFYTGRNNALAFRHALQSMALAPALRASLLARLALDVLGRDSERLRT